MAAVKAVGQNIRLVCCQTEQPSRAARAISAGTILCSIARQASDGTCALESRRRYFVLLW